ncbi:hypothetical protein HanLR1_Chr05g0163811 [Helianthus annuus]|nr:hypothetical protein HanHA89_Chr05g0173731 [Helianthus annuus]KAJ0748908.1 hypothetical protein HanLR1_Chr05g0163811 [Helianthus annuus]
MPFLAKPAWPVVSEHLRHMFLSVALWLAVFTVFIFVCGWFVIVGWFFSLLLFFLYFKVFKFGIFRPGGHR